MRCHVWGIVLHCHRYFQGFRWHVALETGRSLDHISHMALDMCRRLHCAAVNTCDTDSRRPVAHR